MKRLAKTAIAVGMMAAGMGGVAAPAEAHGGGTAVVAGLLGLGAGALIVGRPHDHYYYYAPPPPPPAEVVYAPPPPPPPPAMVYAPPPPPPSYGYDYVQHCRIDNHWDAWQGRYIQSRRCW